MGFLWTFAPVPIIKESLFLALSGINHYKSILIVTQFRQWPTPGGQRLQTCGRGQSVPCSRGRQWLQQPLHLLAGPHLSHLLTSHYFLHLHPCETVPQWQMWEYNVQQPVTFSDTCIAYFLQSHLQAPLLGNHISYTVDVSNVGCHCNSAFYFVQMPGYDAGQVRRLPSKIPEKITPPWMTDLKRRSRSDP